MASLNSNSASAQPTREWRNPTSVAVGAVVPVMATARLEGYERRYRDLARQLGDIGSIASGSVAERFNRCGKANCACHGDPPRLHGPYWHWTAKVDGKTVNRRLSPREAEFYTDWIGNDHRARLLLSQMKEIAAKATDLILKDQPEQPPTPKAKAEV